MKNVLRFLALIFAVITVLSTAGCSILWDRLNENANVTENEEETTTPPVPVNLTVEWEGYRNFTDEEKEELYASLVRLLSNEEQPVVDYDDGAIVGYAPPRPDEPSIANGFELGLFDLTLDGFPELIVNLGGGSAGNSFYYVYDIMSGEKLGDMRGGAATGKCIYLNLESGEYEIIERYTFRNGATGMDHQIGKVMFNEETKEIYTKSLFFVSYEYDMIFETDENGNDAGIDLEIAEVDFYVDGEYASHEEYLYYLNYFEETHSLVPHTRANLVGWSDVAEYTEDIQTKAEKMARALVYENDQKFVKIDK